MSQERTFAGDKRLDNSRWVTVPEPPDRSPLRSVLARALVARARNRLAMTVVSGNDARAASVAPGGGPGDKPTLHLRRPDSFYRRLGADGMIGFGEAFQAGDWDSDDLGSLLTVLVAGVDRIVPPPLQRLRGHRAAPRRPRSEQQTVDGALRNARHHYALPDGLFRAFMDETMCYSSAIFPTDGDGHVVADWESLADAQRRKIDRLLDLVAAGEGTRLLEIGTGWGELAVRAAQRDAYVHTVTNMTEHAEMAGHRISAAGLSDLIRVQVGDYRDIDAEPHSFDAIVSVEMVEAVGRQYWPVYFRQLESLLAPGGRIGLQMMSMPHDRMLRTSATYTWTDKYVFPGGLLPSMTAIEQVLAGHTQLRITGRFSFGAHYAATLGLWRQRFNQNWSLVAQLGFDDVFRRTWNFYLGMSEAGFAAGYLDVHQLLLEREETE
jgi:cyclopropane-fatty-acyl-phospholipid synthase